MTSSDERRENGCVGAKLLAAPLRVRTGDVQLEGGDDPAVSQPSHHLDVVIGGVTYDVDYDTGALEVPLQPRQIHGSNPFQPRVGQADRVEHAASELRHARTGVAMSRFGTHRLGDHTTQALEVDNPSHLPAKSRRSGGKEHRILKRCSEYLDHSATQPSPPPLPPPPFPPQNDVVQQRANRVFDRTVLRRKVSAGGSRVE